MGRHAVADELRGCSAVRMREESDLVSALDEPSSQEVDHPFDSTVMDRWNGNVGIDGQRDSQVKSPR
jgi:hypothetical protein